ncbi:DEAD/DEAH box helicase [Pseudonocardia sp. KRD-184]|uniref:DEAD/DEAH box helicase n=1 Tax=Pseudonocardia oceani TaxID=2792013 RepID=A0ABS6UGW4_9PSEU|nr:DEAD/DEAH box helicase [Pseudonocardia oceani]MBW0092484.1 DEAD/DEAH box helicase [Pseudonocardia oceani]MBW0100231.1 DEAD/DEAH box helicase [Pseudonocardia oceani]MBW0112944.1 DEAD/DEAH box helicase [Pseudonocardia oceani]MBW0123623.1 DEAD/DEAH box helicase [Pseudonocardia oceani]MBW0131460.1 DEAD/DEAH box helicase [Pseudonocardia oceani]
MSEFDLDLPAFSDLPLRDELLAVVHELGYTHPSPIQAQAITPLVEGRDLLGQAATGTGKTAAFALPMLERMADQRPSRERGAAPFGLILAPTRELALQVSEAVQRYGAGLQARVLTVYGGAPVGPQLKALHQGVDVVVATPGRAIDLMNRGALKLHDLEVVVLDEADEMLDMGFVEDIETLLDSTPDTRQAVLFSATMPRRIETLAQKYLREPVTVRIRREEVAEGEAPKVRQTAYLVPRTHTTAALGRVLEAERPKAAIVFCRTRLDVDAVTETLTGRGLRAEALHGGMDQEHRTRVVERLRSGRTELLVATDVAARGLDIDLLTHVVNHDVPQSSEAYVHRIGRVGRAGREGVAITLAPPSKVYALRNVERLTGQTIEMAAVPTAADLRAARLERTREALREALADMPADDDGVAAVVAGLAEEFDAADVATAAIRLMTAAAGTPDDGEDIPVVSAPRSGSRDSRGPRDARDSRGRGGAAGTRAPKAGTTRLFVNAGRASGVRPQDIVGALANESNLTGRDIGAIQIHERHALVEIPEHAADDVLRSLRGTTTLKGRRANVRRDRGFASAGSRD